MAWPSTFDNMTNQLSNCLCDIHLLSVYWWIKENSNRSSFTNTMSFSVVDPKVWRGGTMPPPHDGINFAFSTTQTLGRQRWFNHCFLQNLKIGFFFFAVITILMPPPKTSFWIIATPLISFWIRYCKCNINQMSTK